MNQDQVLGATRAILAAVGGWAVGQGYITADQLTLIGGAVAALISLGWSLTAHTDKAKVAAAQAVPAAQVLVSDPALASAGVKVADPAQVTAVVPVPKPGS